MLAVCANPLANLFSRDLPRKRRSHSKFCRRSSKSQSPLGQDSRVTTASSTAGRCLLPQGPRIQGCFLTVATLADRPEAELTFRRHALYCSSCTAVIRDGCDGRGVSFSQLGGLIESIGHVGNIDDFMIKPIKQKSFLETGLSRYNSSRLSSSRTTVSIAEQAGSI
jgi:hypothetical protein